MRRTHFATGHGISCREDSLKVLIADDEPETVLILSTMVRKLGHMALVARDAMQAYMMAQQQRPDAILLDVRMPAGTGMGALERLKSNVRTTSIPVVVVSGVTDEKTRQDLFANGAAAFLEKPVSEDELKHWLELVTQTPGAG